MVEVKNALGPRVEQRSYLPRQPEAGKNVLISFARAGREISLGDEHRHVGGYAIFMPHLNDVAHEVGLVIKNAPRRFSGIVRIVLERKEGEVFHAVLPPKISEKARRAGGAAA